MKKFFRVFSVFLFVAAFSLIILCKKADAAESTADSINKAYAQTTASYTNYRDCIRLYKLNPEKLYLLAMSAITANNFEILETQSRNHYIIFKTQGREFLLEVMKKDKYYSFLKLTPCDNNYYFSSTIPKKIFYQVDISFNEEIKPLKF